MYYLVQLCPNRRESAWYIADEKGFLYYVKDRTGRGVEPPFDTHIIGHAETIEEIEFLTSVTMLELGI